MKLLAPLSAITALAGIMIIGPLSAQAPGGFGCGTDQARQRLLDANPGLIHLESEYESGLQQYLQAKAGMRDDGDTVVYHIPIVFHILFDPTSTGDNQNVSDAQVYAAVNLLNTDYRKLNSDTSQICCGFNAIAADSRIQFDLATKDPFGNCSNGIDRVTTLRSTLAGDYSKLHPWFRDHYLNVWICNSISSPDVAGYAYFPGDVQDEMGALQDGVLLEYGSMVSFALVHEIGHYLNLQHVWGSNNNAGVACGDDQVADTPVTKGYNLFCPGPNNCSICDPNIQENYQNYMDYSYCSLMYTNGQRDRMRATLNSNISGRSNLWKDTNREYAGVAEYAVTCTPAADFYTLTPFVCAGTSVQFKDNTSHSTPSTWAWSFEGGNPASSTEQNPTVVFDQPGYHPVTLTVGNDFGSNSITKDKVVLIGADYSEIDGLLQESFDSEQRFSKWPVANYENNGTRWTWDDQAGHDGPGCAKLNASDTYTLVQDLFTPNEFSDRDILATPTLDLHYLSTITLNFWYAYAARTTVLDDITESLKIYSSSDCGAHWLLRKTITGGDLVTAGIQAPGYMPGPGDWREVNVSLPSVLATDHVRFKFEYDSAPSSNDIFLDDVNMGAVVGVAEHMRNGAIGLVPNPASNQLSLTLDLAGSSSGTISFLDISGRTVYSRVVNAGEEHLDLDLDKLGITGGMYLVQLVQAKGKRVERLVVQ